MVLLNDKEGSSVSFLQSISLRVEFLESIHAYLVKCVNLFTMEKHQWLFTSNFFPNTFNLVFEIPS